MSAAAAVPMNPEGFAAMVARHVRNWGSKIVAVAKKPFGVAARVARRLHVTQAVRWTAGIAKRGAGWMWHYAKIPLALAVPPIAAVIYAPQFVVVMLGILTLCSLASGFALWRLYKEVQKKAPEEVADLVEDLRRRYQELQDENDRLRRRPEPEQEPEPEIVVEPGVMDAVIVEEVPDDVIVVEEVADEVVHEATAVREEFAQQPFPSERSEKPLPIPYPILQARWIELSKLAEEAYLAEDVDTYSEINGRMAVVMVRTGDKDNKLFPDASWNDIHRENRATQEERQPDYPWNIKRMSVGSQKESKLLKELAAKAKAA